MNISQKFRSADKFVLVVWAVIALGVLARLSQYVINRSLWLDEASLALKITNYSFAELVHPVVKLSEPYLVQFQAAPLGFIVLVKLLTLWWGNSEYVLRFFPLVCGISSIFLFYNLSRRCLHNPIAVFFSVCVFVSSEYLIYYSAELKPYSTDLLIALLLTLLLESVYYKRFSLSSVFFAGILGAVAIWFSFPALFILIGGGAGLVIVSWNKRQHDKMMALALMAVLVVVSSAVYYTTYLKFFTMDKGLTDFWIGEYMPVYPLTMYGIKWYTLKWYYYNFFKPFINPVGLTFSFISGIFSLIGCRSLFKTRPDYFYILLLPIVVTLAASAFYKYPYHGRMLLFLVPAFVLFAAAGLEKMINAFYSKYPLAVWSVVGLLLIHPVVTAGVLTIKPILKEEIKPCLYYLKTHKQPGDGLYLYFASENAFRYYAERYGFKEGDFTVGAPLDDKFNPNKKNKMDYKNDLNKLLKNKRTWILFSHTYPNHQQLILSYLDQIGIKKDSFEGYSASLYLYESSEEQNKTAQYLLN